MTPTTLALMVRRGIIVAFVAYLAGLPVALAQQGGGASEASKRELTDYLKTHEITPDQYVLNKFREHDIVFLGEEHYIRQNVEFVQRLIPELYRAGVYNLGIDFGVSECQPDVDRLITADHYDADLARRIMFKDFVLWSYKEYMDIYRAAWRLNHSLPPGARTFRVVNLIYAPNWAALQGPRTREAMQRVWYKGDGDVYMGERILHEFVDTHQKAVVYAGFHHTFTHYHQPMYDLEGRRVEGFIEERMGNVVYNRIPQRVFGILLHTPWMSQSDPGHLMAPVRGIIDSVMNELHDRPSGFDVVGSPFGTLRDPGTYYAAGYADFTLATLTDGYVYLVPFRKFKSVTVDRKFITDANFREAVENFWDPEMRSKITKPLDLLRLSQKDADEVKTFRRVK